MGLGLLTPFKDVGHDVVGVVNLHELDPVHLLIGLDRRRDSRVNREAFRLSLVFTTITFLLVDCRKVQGGALHAYLRFGAVEASQRRRAEHGFGRHPLAA